MMRKIIFICALFCGMNVCGQNNKLSPLVRQAMMTQKNVCSHIKAIEKKGYPVITAFVRTTDTDVLRQQGCNVYAQWDDIVIASIPLDKISALATMPQIKRIEAERSCSITNDTTATITRAREVWQTKLFTNTQYPTSNTLTGNGVVVGVMDIGFDLTHPTFYSADGQNYRVKQLWDQIDQTEGGEPVTGEDTIYVGRQYIGEEALLSIQHSYDGLEQYHGTHTTGTAVGSGWQGESTNTQHPAPSTYSGMAPDADICLVCNAADNADLIPKEDLYKYTTATDMLGFKYIFDYADHVGKPCVINFSEGSHDDFRESVLYSEVLSKMLGPGHILCSSAGNEGGGDGTYMHKVLGERSRGAFVAKWAANQARYVLRSQKPAEILLAFYRNGVKALEKAYTTQLTDSTAMDTISIEGDTILLSMDTYPSCYDKNQYATDLTFKDLSNERYGYATPTSLTLLGEDNDIEAFSLGGYFVKNNLDPALADYENSHNIFFPGSVEDVISVGATSYPVSRTNIYGNSVGADYGKDGVRANYSSIGPARNGLVKPDVVAPGTNLVSAFGSFWREQNPDDSETTSDVMHSELNGRTYPWGVATGTSMSCPVVTGIIALWLQVCPTLTPTQIKDVFAHTCTHYDETLEYPNNYYGWGQIDAKTGVEYIKNEYTGIKEVQTDQTVQEGDGTYSIDGRRMNNLDSFHGIFLEVKNGQAKKIVK